MSYVSESIVKDTYDLEVGLLIDILQEHLGSEALKEVKDKYKTWESEDKK